MDSESPLDNTADTSLVFEKVFKHPEGLLTARNLVRLLIHEMEDKQPRAMQASQQTITNSFQVSRPISGLNPTMPNALKHILTFSDSHIQAFGENILGGTDLPAHNSNSLETVEQCKIIQFALANGDFTFK